MARSPLLFYVNPPEELKVERTLICEALISKEEKWRLIPGRSMLVASVSTASTSDQWPKRN